MATDDRFTELVLREAQIAPARMEEALHRQVTSGSPLDLVLLEMGLLPEEDVLEFLARATGLAAVGTEELSLIDPSVVMMFPRRLAEKHGIVPLDLTGRRLSVGVHQIPDLGLLDDIGFMLSVYIRPFVTTSPRVEQALSRLYSVPVSPRVENLLGMWGEDVDGPLDVDAEARAQLPDRLNALAANEAASLSSRAPAPPTTAPGDGAGVPASEPANSSPVDSPLGDSPSAETSTDVDADALSPQAIAPAEAPSDAAPSDANKDPEADGWRVVSSGVALRSATGADAPTRAQAEGKMLSSPSAGAETSDPAAVESRAPQAPALATPEAELNPSTVTDDEQRAAQARLFAAMDAEERRMRDEEEARRHERVRWTVDDAIAELALADGRDAMVDVLLRFARRRLATVAMFVHQRDASGAGHFVGWDVISAAWTKDEFKRVTIPAEGTGALAKLADMQSPFLGPLDDEDPLTELWGRAPRASLLVPVIVGNALAGAVYGDCGPKSIPPSSLAELHMVVPRLGKGLRNLIVRSKRRAATEESAGEVEAESNLADMTPTAAPMGEQPVIELDVDFDEISDPATPAPGASTPSFGTFDDDTDAALDEDALGGDAPGGGGSIEAPEPPALKEEGAPGAPAANADPAVLGGESPATTRSLEAAKLGAAMGFVEPPHLADVPLSDDSAPVVDDIAQRSPFMIGDDPDLRTDDAATPDLPPDLAVHAEGMQEAEPKWADHGPLMEPLKRPVDPAFVYTKTGPGGSPLEVIEAPPLAGDDERPASNEAADTPDAPVEPPAAGSDGDPSTDVATEVDSDGTAGDLTSDTESDDETPGLGIPANEDEEEEAAERVIGFDEEEPVTLDPSVYDSVREDVVVKPGNAHAPVELGLVVGEPLEAAGGDDDGDDEDEDEDEDQDDVESPSLSDVSTDELDAGEASDGAVAEAKSAGDDEYEDDDDDDDWEDGEEPIDASVLQLEEPVASPKSAASLDQGLFIGAVVPSDQPDEELVPSTEADTSDANGLAPDADSTATIETVDAAEPDAAEPVDDGIAPIEATEAQPAVASDDNAEDATATSGEVETEEVGPRPLPTPSDVGETSQTLTIVDDAHADEPDPIEVHRFSTNADVSPTEDTAPKKAAEGGPDIDVNFDLQADQFEKEDSTGERPIITGVVLEDEEVTESAEVAKGPTAEVSLADIDALDAAFRRKSEGHPIAPGPEEGEVVVALPGAEALSDAATSPTKKAPASATIAPVPTLDEAAARDPNIPPPLPKRGDRKKAPAIERAGPPVVSAADADIHEAQTLPPGLRSCAPSPGANARESVLLATWRNWMQHEDPEMDALLAELQQPGEVGRGAVGKIARYGDRAMPSLARYFPGVIHVHPFGPMDARPEVAEFSDALAVLERIGVDAAAPILAAEVRHDDRLHRYAAVWALSELQVPSTLPRLAERVFDPEWRIALLAIDVLHTYKRVPAFARLLVELRKYVGKGDEFQRKRAILAVAELRDREALPQLVDLLGTRPKTIAEEARRALVDVTKQDYGSSGRRWRAWLADNGNRPRIEWLLDGLAHKDIEIRQSSQMELERLTQNFFGYRYDAGRQERDSGIAQWRAWWAKQSITEWE